MIITNYYVNIVVTVCLTDISVIIIDAEITPISSAHVDIGLIEIILVDMFTVS